MVVKVTSSNRKIFSENSENNKGNQASKRVLKTPSKLSQKGVSSPSKTPLCSSSLSNINFSPLKQPQIILPKTPIKQERSPVKCQQFYCSSSPVGQHVTSSDSFTGCNIKYENDLLASPLSVSPPNSPGTEDESGLFGSPGSSPDSELKFNPHPDASSLGRSIVNGDRGSSCRKRVMPAQAGDTSSQQQQKPPPVSRRNARERNRVKQVSLGFALLRQHVPQANRKKKLSKVETLRCAVEYIKGLQKLLQEHPHPGPNSTSQLKSHPHSYLHPQSELLDSNTDHFLQMQGNPLNPDTNMLEQTTFILQKVSAAPVSFQHSYPSGTILGPNSFYDDRLHQVQMQRSCFESQILKVPKTEDQYQPTPIYSTSVFSLPSSVSYLKSSPTGSFSSGSSSLTGSPLQENKESIAVGTQLIQESPQTGLVSKETSDMDLMEALAWWQHNS